MAASSYLLGQTPSNPLGRPTLGIDQGLSEFDTTDFRVKLVKASQTLAALEPKSAAGFDFTPADRLNIRAANGFYHLGDIIFTLRCGNGPWTTYSTGIERKPIDVLSATAPDLAKADLSPTLPADCPIRVIRTWTVESGRLALHFELQNKTDQPVEIGRLGIPMVFNNILTDRDLAEANEKCSFSDPYIGMDAGYVQVTRLKGSGPALIVVPSGKTPFEAYQLLKEPMRPQQTFEGMFEWIVHSKALAETEWGTAIPWNSSTSEVLPPQGVRKIGVRFLLSDRIQNIEKTLAENRRPVAVGIPGYVLPTDIDGKLFLKATAKVRSTSVEPKDAMTVTPSTPIPKSWQAFDVRGKGWGRARLSITYADGTQQTIQYYITKPASTAVADLGRFLFSKQWYENPSDPFKRSPSVISFDREKNAPVEQDNRVWIAGLGDEGGSGSWVAAAIKEFIEPDPGEIAKYERFIDEVLW